MYLHCISDAEATLRENSHLCVSSKLHGSQLTMGCKENISGVNYTFLFQGFTEINFCTTFNPGEERVTPPIIFIIQILFVKNQLVRWKVISVTLTVLTL